MPTRTATATAIATANATATTTTTTTTTRLIMADEEEVSMLALQFSEPLSWRIGKAIPIADLLRRLQVLFKELRDMDQGEIQRDSFTKVAKELISPNLLAHKDKGVKAWTACCLVEILRLFAPDAPYTGQQLKDIFTMLITTILPALSDPSDAYNYQHLHALSSLAEVKSIVLLTDIPKSESLTLHLFTSFFDVLSGSAKSSTGEQLGKNVEYNMTEILGAVVEESTSLSSEIIDVVMAQFLRTDPRALHGGSAKPKKHGAQLAPENQQSTLELKDLPPAYNLAKRICEFCPEKMARHVSQYFNDVIVDASRNSTARGTGKGRANRKNSGDLNDSGDEEGVGPTEEDLKDLRKAHQLIRELWRASPAVLQNVTPQLELELSAENIQLRFLATETFGDMISGIGAAGLPQPPIMNPSAYPPITLADSTEIQPSPNLLTKPSSPLHFPRAHPAAYASFLRRQKDKSPIIRSVWTTAIGRILSTSAGGVGLSQQEEETLIDALAQMLSDADEKVRIAAIKAAGTFSIKDIITRLGASGSVTTDGSVLGTLADRVRDRKHAVRTEATTALARMWGVSAGEIAAGDEQVISTVGAAPSKILDAYYANDMDINVLLDHVLFEQLLPLSYPPIKAKNAKSLNGSSQRVKDSQANDDNDTESIDPDKIRTERILILIKNLDERSKRVFFAMQSRQVVLAQLMTAYLQRCENYNGGVMDENETQIKEHLTRLIENFSKFLPDPSKVTSDLWKFAKLHDRRCYQLIRFCIAPESDHRTVVKAIKEFTKRIETSSAGLLETLTPILYRVSLIIYNKSHVPAIIDYSQSDEKSLASIAHEVLQEISSKTPEVLKAHVQAMCRSLQDEAPTAKKPNDPSAIENLKACASFASKFVQEIPRDRKFVQAMTSFALFGTPPEAAKYAVSIIMTTSDKKELLAKDLVKKCVDGFSYDGQGFLSRLATLSQLMLLAPNVVDEESDVVVDIAIQQILLQVRTSTDPSEPYMWSATVNTECEAKCWALKILVNRVRSHTPLETLADVAAPVYDLLSTLIAKKGEISPQKNTPSGHKPRLRLLAALLFLKLSTKKAHDSLLTPAGFTSLTLVANDSEMPVRSGFLNRLKKYLNRQRLPQRFYTIPFLYAFEPNNGLKSETATWIRSQAVFFSKLKSQSTVLPQTNRASITLESVFARLISLLAHHPDYSSIPEELVDFGRFIIFYLQNVATEENISLIYHIAQRVKQYRDAISPHTESEPSAFDSNLFHLSDLAQLTIRKYEEAQFWTIQTLPAKIKLPSSLFVEIKSHDEAQQIAERNYLPEGVEEEIETLLRASIRAARSAGKKRKSEGEANDGARESKRVKGLPIRKANVKEKRVPKAGTRTKTPKKKVPSAASAKANGDEGSSARRRSGRVKPAEGKSYAERDDEEDDEEMEVLSWEYIDGGPSQDEDEGGDGDGDGDGDEMESNENGEEDDDHVSAPKPENEKISSATKRNKTKTTFSPSVPAQRVKPKEKNPRTLPKPGTEPPTRKSTRATAKRKSEEEQSGEGYMEGDNDDDDDLSDPPDEE